MNKVHFLTTFFLLSGSISAQHKIDLSKITPPAINYLELGHTGPAGKEIRVNNLYLEEGGIPQLPVMGEIHYNRMDHRYWRDALLKMKASGIDIVATYCIWSLHEEVEGELSWEGHLNLRRFIELCKELDMKVHLRFGPYCNAEIKNGGLPDWIVNNKNLVTRSNDPLYIEYTRRWYQAVYDQVKGLLWKDGGPIMALQLENEYVRPGMIVPHLLNLKKMAVEIGFDLPLYSMTHWMDSEYPKGEIVPYAGFYIEAPWTASGKNEIPTSNFEFFTYNRLSDNIGTDIIKLEGDVESLSGENNDSPFFTCEIGVGTTAFYHRRAVVPEEMAGENINLRLGCGANLMGYYMYTGGTNPVGKISTYQSSGPRVSYDYQAPIREFGTLGTVMQETKKYNYFMNDFGTALAPAVAYLPTSNQDRDNLQWAVRLNESTGYLFCSNYLYKHTRKDYKNVQFSIKLKDETIRIPRKKVTVKGGTYFLWPFNQQFSEVLLKYSTTQPVCSLKEGNTDTYFFFEDDFIPGEYLIEDKGIRNVEVKNGTSRKEKNAYFIDRLTPGKECSIEITKENGSKVRFVTLTEEESDHIWKGTLKGKEFVAITNSSLIYDNNKITLINDLPSADIWIYKDGNFKQQTFQTTAHNQQAEFRPITPMEKSLWIRPTEGNIAKRQFSLSTFSKVERAYLRYVSSDPISCMINGKETKTTSMGSYSYANVTDFIQNGNNTIEFNLSNRKEITAEIEVLLKNGKRILWNTDATWLSADNKPVATTTGKNKPSAFAPEEHVGLYEVKAPAATCSDEETRMYISYKGDVANAYLNGNLIGDSFYDGTEWILSLSRLKESIDTNPMVIRIDGLKSADIPIYFEKNVVPADCVVPTISDILVKQEYRFDLKK
ncbi:beta-galactosidase [Parabacteroides goldsteinii]|uniref:beta-galactosidase n=2 Tax=Parabacteroides goldsteinii TaxID=328812 RepID=UPI0021652BE1|nr:beta-galactosidase [Parabacteroides goldsteinii]MCS2428625.1 beta-galactosidase [Parabacteroides goldsteinii]